MSQSPRGPSLPSDRIRSRLRCPHRLCGSGRHRRGPATIKLAPPQAIVQCRILLHNEQEISIRFTGCRKSSVNRIKVEVGAYLLQYASQEEKWLSFGKNGSGKSAV